MSFMKTLATLAVGFAAAKGFDKYRKAGGMDGVKDALQKSTEPGGNLDQLAQMAEKMGVPGGAQGVKDMMARAGGAAEGAVKAGEAGLASLMAAMGGAATAGTGMLEKMIGSMTGGAGALAGAAMEDNAKLMIRAMIMAAKADGTVDDEEKSKIMGMIGDDATEEEKAFVQAELDAPVDVAALASATGETMRTQIYAASVMAMRADTAAERAYLDQLAAALGLDAAARTKVHNSLGT